VYKRQLYGRLREILELYAGDRRAYMLVAARAAATIPAYFNSHRALLEYVARAYA